MKVTTLQQNPQNVLFHLDTPQIFKSDCVSFDDDEVNAANAKDVIESCKDTSYSHIVQTRSGNYDLYFPSDEHGMLLYDLPLISYPTGKLAEAMIKLFGPDTMVYHHLPEIPLENCEFDGWHPDHKI